MRKFEAGGREVRQQSTRVRSATRFGVDDREQPGKSLEPRIVGDHLLGGTNQIAHGSALPAHHALLDREEHGGVGFAALGPEPQGLGGQLFGPVGVTGDLPRARQG